MLELGIKTTPNSRSKCDTANPCYKSKWTPITLPTSVKREMTDTEMKITVGDYNFALGYVGAEFEFKFTSVRDKYSSTATEYNASTIVRIYLPDPDFVNIGTGSLTVTSDVGTAAYDAGTNSVKVSGLWPTETLAGTAVTLRIKGWKLPNSRGGTTWSIATLFEYVSAEYVIDYGKMILIFSPNDYEMTMT